MSHVQSDEDEDDDDDNDNDNQTGGGSSDHGSTNTFGNTSFVSASTQNTMATVRTDNTLRSVVRTTIKVYLHVQHLCLITIMCNWNVTDLGTDPGTRQDQDPAHSDTATLDLTIFCILLYYLAELA